MNRDTVYFLSATGILCALLIVFAIRYLNKLRSSAKTTWEDLLEKLISVDRKAIETVALDAIEPSGQRRTDERARALDFDQIWALLGGLDGVERLEKNSRVLIDMAAYLQRWYPEAVATAEELRLQARELEWQVGRLRSAAENDGLSFHFASYGQNAAVTYYLMGRRLLSLYEQSRLPMFVELQSAL
jgi:hypothetical protein